jgi:HK97 gp10 family phage protein
MPTQITFAQFREQIRESDKKLIENLNKALMILALKGEAQAKKNATKDPRVRTGRLRSSITGLVDAKNGNPRVVLRAGGDTSGSPVNYARYVEFGTKYMYPRLFMGRAVQKITKDDVPKQLENLLALSLDQK